MFRDKRALKESADQVTFTAPVPVGPWNFHQRAHKTKGVISTTIKESNWSKKTRAHFDRAIDQLKHLPMRSWSKPQPASKIGDHTYVIRFKDSNSSQLRIFGHFHHDHHAFVMTFDGYEKDYVYYPENYQDLAKQHRKDCDAEFAVKTQAFEKLCGHRQCAVEKP